MSNITHDRNLLLQQKKNKPSLSDDNLKWSSQYVKMQERAFKKSEIYLYCHLGSRHSVSLAPITTTFIHATMSPHTTFSLPLPPSISSLPPLPLPRPTPGGFLSVSKTMNKQPIKKSYKRFLMVAKT